MKTGLLPEATHVVLPDGIVSTGAPATEATCRKIGIVFDGWQRDLNRCILAKASGGAYAADTVVLSIPRQVGKTFDVGGIIFADSIINPRTTSVWTAHRFKVARESFEEMRSWARSPHMAQHIDADRITTAAGNESIPFRNGSRIVFAARERGAIRGFTKVRRLVLDEAQILTEHALSDLVPTMNQADNPQLILMGTPPKPTDPGEVFTRLRTEALQGDSEGLLYVEFSAPSDCDPNDRGTWRKANPSYPVRTSAKAILRMRKLLSVDDFRREALGIWDEDAADGGIDPLVWAKLADASSQIVGALALAVDTTPERGRTAIGVAGRRVDGLRHVEVIEHRPGTGWVVDRVVELVDRWQPCATVIDPAGAAGAFIPELLERGVEVMTMTAREAAQAYGGIVDDVKNERLRHLDQAGLNGALEGAGVRNLADARAWSRKDSAADISPLVAVTNAAYGFAVHAPEPDYDLLSSVL